MFKEVVSPTLWMCWGLTSVVVATAGPFGTFDSQPFLWRLAYWSVLIAAAIIIAIFMRAMWRGILVDASETHEDIAVSVSLALVFAPLVVVLNSVVGGPQAYQMMGVWAAMACVFVIAVGTIAFRRAIRESAVISSRTPPRDRLLGRISAKEGARLCRISSDNHHIRVKTSDGEEYRTLMRLTDAVKEVDVEPGFYVHRSHWVARAAISHASHADGRDFIELICGDVLPVGPKCRPNMVIEGFITE